MLLGLHISWATPAWFLLLALLPAAWWIRVRRGEPGLAFGPAPLMPPVGSQPVRTTWRQRFRAVPWLLRATAWISCVAALAQPTSRVALPRTTVGLDVLLCLDVSSSMAGEDMGDDTPSSEPTTRLVVAKAAAARFIANRPEDRVGLVTFAAYADLVCPLTLDHSALEDLLDQVELVERDGPEDLTGIGNAVARAASILAGSDAASRLVVLLSDGEENVAHADAPTEIGPAQAATMAREYGVRVYTIAAGRGNPGPNGGFAPLNTQAIEQLAEATRGAFFRAEDETAMEEVFGAIDQLEKSPLEDQRYQTKTLHPWLLWFAVGALLLSLALRVVPFGVRP